jgi:PadR family transcriptional regulator PadR
MRDDERHGQWDLRCYLNIFGPKSYITYTSTMRVHLGEFELLLLLALLQAKDEMYGVQIRVVIEERTGRTVSPGAIYTALDRLERRNLVCSRLGDPTEQRGGKRKRYYRIESAGATLLRQSQRALAQMARGVSPELEAL